jgi:predicted Fe-Mo cluster-binding NifX family protein
MSSFQDSLPRILHPLVNEEIKILLLEGISQEAVAVLRAH